MLVHGQNDDGDWGPLTAVFLDVTVGSVDTVHVLGSRMRHCDFGGGRHIVFSTLRIVDWDVKPVQGATVRAEWLLPDGATGDQQV